MHVAVEISLKITTKIGFEEGMARFFSPSHSTAPEWAHDSRETSVKLSATDPLRSPTHTMTRQISRRAIYNGPALKSYVKNTQ